MEEIIILGLLTGLYVVCCGILNFFSPFKHCYHDWEKSESPIYYDHWKRQPQQSVSMICKKCGKHKSFDKY